MKYIEIIKEADTTVRHEISLRHLHKLKLIRARNKKALDAKKELAAIMYSDPDQQMEDTKLDLQKQAAELDIKKKEIGLDIEKAEIDAEMKAEMGKKALQVLD